MFLAASILPGIATGCTGVAGQLYLIETASTNTRGFITGTTLIWMVFYNLVNYTLGAYVLWKWLALINCLIQGIYLVFTWAVVPESPQWLLAQGRTEEAEKVLQFLKNSPKRLVMKRHK